jgi:uncharacterized protein YciI
MTKYLLIYENGDLSLAPTHFPAHREAWSAFVQRGVLVMIGPVVSSPLFGALAVFTTREDAEAFAKSDPFVTHGVVSRWSVAEWKEALTP